MLEVLYHHAKLGGARISPAAGVDKNVEFFYRQHCAQRKSAGISFTQRPILRFFTKFADFVLHFRMRWVLKFGWICSRGYGVMGVLS